MGRKRFGFFLMVILFIAGSCSFGGDGGKKNGGGSLTDKEQLIEISFSGSIVSAADNSLIMSPVNISFNGSSAQLAREGLGITDKKVINDGKLEFKMLAPSISSIDFTVVVFADGYISNSIRVNNISGKSHFFTLKLVKIDKVPEGVSVVQQKLTTVDPVTNKTVAESVIKTDKSESVTTTATVILPAGTVIKDSTGTPLSGELSSTVGYFSPEKEEAIAAFPGGLNVNVLREDGGTNDGFFVTGGFISIDIIDENGRVAKTFEGNNLQISMEIPDGLMNPETGEPVKKGDVIPLSSYNKETGEWKEETRVTRSNRGVLKQNDSLLLSFEAPHLSYWNIDWFNPDSVYESRPIVLDGVNTNENVYIKLSAPGYGYVYERWISYYDNRIIFLNVPGFPLNIIVYNMDRVEIGRSDNVRLGDTGSVTIVCAKKPFDIDKINGKWKSIIYKQFSEGSLPNSGADVYDMLDVNGMDFAFTQHLDSDNSIWGGGKGKLTAEDEYAVFTFNESFTESGLLIPELTVKIPVNVSDDGESLTLIWSRSIWTLPQLNLNNAINPYSLPDQPYTRFVPIEYFDQMVPSNFYDLPDTDIYTEVNMQGSAISWGGTAYEGVTPSMKKLGNNKYGKIVKIKSNSAIPEWVLSEPGNFTFKFRTGDKWGDVTEAFGADYGTYLQPELISLNTKHTLYSFYQPDGKSSSSVHPKNICINVKIGDSYYFEFDAGEPSVAVYLISNDFKTTEPLQEIYSDSRIPSNFYDLPDTDVETEINMEGSLITWGGTAYDGITSSMKKLGDGRYGKIIKISTMRFIPEWLAGKSDVYNAEFKFRTGDKWAHESGALGTDYASLTNEFLFIGVGESKTVKANTVFVGLDNVLVTKLKYGRTYYFEIDTKTPSAGVYLISDSYKTYDPKPVVKPEDPKPSDDGFIIDFN